MAKFASVKKIVVEDFESKDRTLVQKLSIILNPFFEKAVTAFNQQLTYKDNLKTTVYNLSLDAGVSTLPVAWELNEKPTAVYIGNVTKFDGSAVSSVFSLSWYFENGKIKLTFLGLDASKKHLVTVVGQV
jgi:hypothetical protein